MPEDFSFPKLGVPITLALAAGWVVASFVYGAGSKVGASEKDLAYLAARVDALTAQMKDLDSEVRIEQQHDIELQTRLTTLKDYVDSVEASKSISVTMPDTKHVR